MISVPASEQIRWQEGEHQTVQITESFGLFTITNNAIVKDSFSINYYVTTADGLNVGSCVAAEMTCLIENGDGLYTRDYFLDKWVSVTGYLTQSDTLIPYGTFKIDTAKVEGTRIRIAALDGMLLLEQPVDWTQFTFPCTVSELFYGITTIFGLLPCPSITMVNGSYNIVDAPTSITTYRELLRCIAEINGCNAFFNRQGYLCMKWYGTASTSLEMTTANRTASELDDNLCTIANVEISDGENSWIGASGSYGKTVKIANNPLITADQQTVANNIIGLIGGTQYYAFSAKVLPSPWVEPMDSAVYVDAEGNEFPTFVTDITYRMNADTLIACKGNNSSYMRQYAQTSAGASLDEAINLLKQAIIENAEVVRQQMDEITQTLHGEYVAISQEFGQYKNETDAKITANAEGINQAYSNIESIDSKYSLITDETNNTVIALENGAIATNTDFRRITEAYIKSGLLYYENNDPVYGVAVGQLTYEVINGETLLKRQGMYSVFTANELAFFIGETKVAYFANNKMFITAAEFVNSLKVGRFIMTDDTTDGFTIRYGG